MTTKHTGIRVLKVPLAHWDERKAKKNRALASGHGCFSVRERQFRVAR